MKVPAPQPEPSLNPIQASPEQDAPADIQLGSQPQEPIQPEKENPFADQGFDAGIDVDEDADPKKYIEKLTGKLAQKLRDYNGNEKDIDLNKFVINSLIPSAIPQMDETDANDVIKKVQDNIGKGNEVAQGNEVPQDNIEAPQQDNTVEMPPIPEEQPIQQESIEPNVDDLVSEILGRKKLSRNIGNKTPFQSPKFK